MVAGMGFEPHDLRVMSPTSYQTALPRDIQVLLGTFSIITEDRLFVKTFFENFDKKMFCHIGRTFYCLEINYSKTFQYRTKENHNNENRSNILNHNCIQFFVFELTTGFHLFYNRLWLDDISCKYTSKECYDRHNHTITQEIKKVQNRKSPYLNMVPNTKS